MSSIARPPDPCLVAIILIVRSRAGPRFVFHYPPNPLSDNGSRNSIKRRYSSRKNTQGTKNNESASSDESSTTSDDEDEASYLGNSGSFGRPHSNHGIDENILSASTVAGESQRPPSLVSSRASARKRGANSDIEEDQGSSSDARRNGSGENTRPSWETLLGLTTDVWEKLLSPSRTWHKRRFEVGINDLSFVGWPVFVRDDGTWRKQKRKKKKPRAEWEGGDLGHEDQLDKSQPGEGDTAPESTAPAGAKSSTVTDGKNPTDAKSKTSKSDELPDSDKDSMTMFNVVFVLDPPQLEYSIRIKENYENVIKKFGKALKWEQARADYVWTEAQTILHIKEKAKEQTSKIASVTLSPDVSISLQIPPLTSTSYLPTPMDTAYPGLWLTTADSLSPADDTFAVDTAPPHQILAKHFALLLLDNEATILKDVEASGGALGPALAHYIRCSKPTKSFAQISAVSGIPLSNIQLLASHLVYWRRARAIPPLHQRDTYIVSPNCDLSKLEAATAAYAVAFPTLPSLPKMLSALSRTPRPYGSFIPSNDHKEAYFAILAWLLRGGWVTQLRAFARVKVTPEVKMAVEMAMRREEMDKLLSQHKISSSPPQDGDGSDDEDDNGSSSSSSLESQASGQQTPIPGHYGSEPSMHLSQSLINRDMHMTTSSLIPFPHRASPLEARWLDEIMTRFPDRVGSDPTRGVVNGGSAGADADDNGYNDSLKTYWPIFTKYFNGHDALEKIPVREGLKRKVVWHMLMRMGLNTGQPGFDPDPREKVLVSVRHW
ncbi:Nitrogen permease regulator 3 [Paecilomyces lecythidis]|uniref:Nitrogen permease regulator 3 n=1 Tax=Paecilomyces lecythidis TaxID=3004212 RepID=A0ABR3XHA3_9EURO